MEPEEADRTRSRQSRKFYPEAIGIIVLVVAAWIVGVLAFF